MKTAPCFTACRKRWDAYFQPTGFVQIHWSTELHKIIFFSIIQRFCRVGIEISKLISLWRHLNEG